MQHIKVAPRLFTRNTFRTAAFMSANPVESVGNLCMKQKTGTSQRASRMLLLGAMPRPDL